MAVAQPSPRQISSILRQLDGGRLEMMCPRCGNWTDAGLGYKTLQIMRAHQDALNPVVKCMKRDCGHAFSPKWLASEG